jgi:hypothetical protein
MSEAVFVAFLAGLAVAAILSTLFSGPHQREAYWDGREDGELIASGREPKHENNYAKKNPKVCRRLPNGEE